MVTAWVGKTLLPISAPTRIRPSRVVVLIDESRSMAGTVPPKPFSHEREALRALKQTLSILMAQLPPGVSVEFGLFNEKSAFTDTFISEPGELQKAIAAVKARFGKGSYGHTAIYDSLYEALRRFGTPQTGDTILLLTDGGDNNSKLGANKLEQEFRTAKTRLLAMMVYEPHVILDVMPEDEQFGRNSVQNLVEKTGGYTLAIDPKSPAWADPRNVLRTSEMVRHFWNDWVLSTDIIQIQVPGTLTKEANWTLSVNREVDARLKHAVVIYPTRLSPCPVVNASAH
jgi:hypothetical protein